MYNIYISPKACTNELSHNPPCSRLLKFCIIWVYEFILVGDWMTTKCKWISARLLMHWRYYSLTLSHQYILRFQLQVVKHHWNGSLPSWDCACNWWLPHCNDWHISIHVAYIDIISMVFKAAWVFLNHCHLLLSVSLSIQLFPSVNTLRPGQNGRHFQMHFLDENVSISIKSSLKCVPKGPINNIPALV